MTISEICEGGAVMLGVIVSSGAVIKALREHAITIQQARAIAANSPILSRRTPIGRLSIMGLVVGAVMLGSQFLASGAATVSTVIVCSSAVIVIGCSVMLVAVECVLSAMVNIPLVSSSSSISPDIAGD